MASSIDILRATRFPRFGFVLTLLVASFGTAGATTIHIRSDHTGDAPTIKGGVALAAVNDTVLIEGGLYVEDSVVVAKDVTITGPATGWPVIRGRSNQTIFRSMPGATPTFQRMVLANANIGILARNDVLSCSFPGANMVVREVVLDSCAVGIDADDSGCTRGNATLDRLTAYGCGLAYSVNDFGSVTASNLVAVRCGTALQGFHYLSASFSCLLLWQNTTTSDGGQPITPVNVVTANPRLCNPASGNFGVGPGSPCLPANNSCGVQLGALGQSCASYVPGESAATRVALVTMLGIAGLVAVVRRRRRFGS